MGRIRICFDVGVPLGKLRTLIFHQLHSRFHNARDTHNPTCLTILHCLASLLFRYNTNLCDRNIKTSRTLNHELQHILFTSMDRPTLRVFSSPIVNMRTRIPIHVFVTYPILPDLNNLPRCRLRLRRSDVHSGCGSAPGVRVRVGVTSSS